MAQVSEKVANRALLLLLNKKKDVHYLGYGGQLPHDREAEQPKDEANTTKMAEKQNARTFQDEPKAHSLAGLASFQ